MLILGQMLALIFTPDNPKRRCHYWLGICSFCLCLFTRVLVISRIYTGGSRVCFLAVLGSLRTRTRIDIRMFYLVSYCDCVSVPCCCLSLLYLVHSTPPLSDLCCLSNLHLELWHLMKFNCFGLRCVDSSVMTLLLFFQMILPGWCSRARRTTSTPATSRCASLMCELCVVSLSDIKCKLILYVCMCVCLHLHLCLRWRPQCPVFVYVMLRLRVHCHRPALTFGRLFGSSRYTPSSC